MPNVTHGENKRQELDRQMGQGPKAAATVPLALGPHQERALVSHLLNECPCIEAICKGDASPDANSQFNLWIFMMEMASIYYPVSAHLLNGDVTVALIRLH